MRPTLGRIVLYRGIQSNGSMVHPAMVTAVWSDTCVNLTVFRDNDCPVTRTSAVQLENPELGTGWFWPPREGSGADSGVATKPAEA